MVLYTLLRWSCLRVAMDSRWLWLREGFFFRRTTAIPADRITVVASVRSLWLRPFGVSLIQAETPAGSDRQADFQLYLSAGDTGRIFQVHAAGEDPVPPETSFYRPKNASVLLLSLFTSNSLVGLLLLSALLQNLGDIVGEDLAHRLMTRLGSLGELLAFGVPPAAAMAALIALLGWSVAFLSEFLRNKNFLAVRTGRVLNVHRGLFTLRSVSVLTRRISFVELRETALSRLPGLGSVWLHAVGIARRQEDLLPVIPIVRLAHLPALLDGLLPEFRPGPVTLRPVSGSFLRFAGAPLGAMAGLAAGGWALGVLWPDWRELTLWFALGAGLLCLWFLWVRILDLRTAGIGYTENNFTLKYSKRLTLHTVIIPRESVVGVTLRQSVFQAARGSCDLLLDSFAQGRRRHRVRNLSRREAELLLKSVSFGK